MLRSGGMVKEAQAKGIKTEFVGWNEDHTEGRCKMMSSLSISSQTELLDLMVRM